MVANRPSAFLRASSVPFFMHFVRGFAAWAFPVPPDPAQLNPKRNTPRACPRGVFARLGYGIPLPSSPEGGGKSPSDARRYGGNVGLRRRGDRPRPPAILRQVEDKGTDVEDMGTDVEDMGTEKDMGT